VQSWSQGGPETQVYTTGGYLGPITLDGPTMRWRGVSLSAPVRRMQLTIDGRSNWPTYSFIWAVGSTHTISAPLQQAARGGSTPSTTVDGDRRSEPAVHGGHHGPSGVTATYDVMGQLRILSSPVASAFWWTECVPDACVIDRKPGTQAVVVAPASVQLTDMSRLDFTSWSDGAARQRT